MKNTRSLAAGLMLLTGLLHLASVVLVKFEPTSTITIVFGVAYLVIGFFLFRSGCILSSRTSAGNVTDGEPGGTGCNPECRPFLDGVST